MMLFIDFIYNRIIRYRYFYHFDIYEFLKLIFKSVLCIIYNMYIIFLIPYFEYDMKCYKNSVQIWSSYIMSKISKKQILRN